ncbi:MAG: class I SAM-dependent methyltransferase [Solirubrobacteraceae bacterium]
MATDATVRACRICGSGTRPVGTVRGAHSGRDFELARCAECGYAFIVDPLTDFARIYDEDYYAGRGADPLVDYAYELEHPTKTVRQYEWRGLAMIVAHLLGPLSGRRWIDFGAGNGGLVRYLREREHVDAVGFEEGAIAQRAAALGIPVRGADALAGWAGSADVVTAVEVLEHVLDPVAELRAMRELLKPGGLLLITTGNARAHAKDLARWRYIVPEIHISFFEPRTLERAFALAGLRAEHPPLGRGFDYVIAFKVLKNLGVSRRTAATDLLPRRAVRLLADRMERLSEHPVGWAI